MKRVLVVTLLSLGAAGCAQSRSALSQQDPPGSTTAKSKLGPVAVNPVPSLYDTVNRSMGNSAVVRSAIKDPDDPRWSGRAPASVALNPGGPVPADSGQSQTQMALAGDAKPTTPTATAAVPAQGPLATQLPATAAVPAQAPLATELPATAAVPAQAPLVTELPATAAVPAQGPLATPLPATEAPVASPEATARGAVSAEPLSGPDAAAAIAANPVRNPAPASQPEALTNPIALPAPDSPRDTLTMPTPRVSPAPDSTPPRGDAVPSDPPGTSMGLPVSGPIPVPPEGPQNGAPALPALPDNALANPPGPLTPGSPDIAPPPGGSQDALANPPSPLPPGSPDVAPPPSGGPQGALVNPSGSLAPASPEGVPTRQARKPIADPLLGPNPQLMPPIPDVTEADAIPVKKTAQPARAMPAAGPAAASLKPTASSTPTAVPDVKPPALPDLPELPPAAAAPAPSQAPAQSPAAAPAPIELEVAPSADPGAGVAPAPAEKPAGSGGSAALTEPASAGSVAALPVLEVAPQAASAAATLTAQTASGPAGSPRSDPQVVLASGEKTKQQPPVPPDPASLADRRRRVVLPEPGRPLAKVGEEVVTYHDLMGVVLQHRAYEQLRNAYLAGGAAEKREAEKQITMMKIALLDELINRSLLAQEAKRHITKRKEGATMLNSIYEEADQRFRESEVLPLQRKLNLDTESQVKEKLAEQGWSLSEMQQAFRQKYIGEMYLYSILRDKIKAELPDMRKYYSEHAEKHEFDRPALITWREIVVEPVKSPPREGTKDDTKIPFEGDSINLAAARGEATAILERLRKGEDFAKLARTESDGPAASRSHGGLMETSPGGYGIPAVNKALESLPIGQVSDLIEAPDGYHIVKVEKRRAAGPATFEEVQNQIKPLIENEKGNRERIALITKLRKNNYIRIYSEKSKKVDEPKPAKT